MNQRQLVASLVLTSSIAAGTPAARAADPWADNVVNYTAGDGITNDFYSGTPYSDAATALGEPTRFTSPDNFGGAVTPLNSPFRSNEVVSIGRGGSLVVGFDEPVTNDPLNPFGVDLLVFGNAFFVGTFFNPDFSFNPAGTANGVSDEGGLIEVSSDGVTFYPVNGSADGMFPTNAYADIVDPFATAPGAVPANFTRPVDPSFNTIGKTFAEIVASYAGAGGGLGIDIGPTGLSSVSFVRITNASTAQLIPEIDALADVASIPEPSSMLLITCALILLGKTARRVTVKLEE